MRGPRSACASGGSGSAPGAGGQQLDLVADPEAVAGERARHHGSGALDREHAVDVQACASVVGRPGAVEHRVERRRQRFDAFAGLRGHREDRRAGEAGVGDVFADLLRRQVERLVVDEVALRERDHASAHAEDVEDLQVLLGLRLPPLVGRDHEQHEPDRTDAGEHVADESLVPRDVDEADLATGREHAPRVAEIDREAAALLLRPAVGVDARQPDDQRRLAVVDVAGRRDDPERSLRRGVSPRRRRHPRGRTGSRA